MRAEGAVKYQDLHRFWQHQLLLEFESICQSYGVHLDPPVFEINRSKKRLGGWNPATRSLTLSQHLIINYPWSTTLHVLKHEMAHQFCSEKFQTLERPHGQDFQEACQLLGVPYEYRSARVDLFKVIETDSAANQKLKKGRRVQKRVEKLLALSQSGNEHEAALALVKAYELVRKYQLDIEIEDDNVDFSYVIIDKKRKRLASYQKSICMILSEYFLVKVIISELYDPHINDTFRTIELLGKRENLVIAEYCYYYLENQLQLLWDANKNGFKTGNKRSQKNSYFMGVLHGFYLHLGLGKKEKTDTPSNSQSRALIKVQEEMLNVYVAMRFPRLTRGTSRRTKVRKDVYEKGVESGKVMRFTRGIDEGNKNSGGYLTSPD